MAFRLSSTATMVLVSAAIAGPLDIAKFKNNIRMLLQVLRSLGDPPGYGNFLVSSLTRYCDTFALAKSTPPLRLQRIPSESPDTQKLCFERLAQEFSLHVLCNEWVSSGEFCECHRSFISSITTTVSTMRASRAEEFKHHSLLVRFFTERNLSVDLFGKVSENLKKQGAYGMRLRETDVRLLKGVPDRLKVVLHEEMFKSSLMSLGFWRHWRHPDDEAFCRQVCHLAMQEPNLSPNILSPKQ